MTETPFNPKDRFVGAFIPADFMRIQEISAGSKLVYARMVQYASDINGHWLCWANHEAIAHEVGMTRRGVINAIDQLLREKFITQLTSQEVLEIQEIKGKLTRKTCTYEIIEHPFHGTNQRRKDLSQNVQVKQSTVQKVHTQLCKNFTGHKEVVDKYQSTSISSPFNPPKGDKLAPAKDSNDKDDEIVHVSELTELFTGFKKSLFKNHHPPTNGQSPAPPP